MNFFQVRKYHAAFYRPENLTFVVTGKVKAEKVFAALQPIEDKINGRGDREIFCRPWQTPVEPIKESQDLKVYKLKDIEKLCTVIN